MNSARAIKLVIAAIAGALCVASFAPFENYWLPFICLSVLFYVWQDATPKFAFALGFVFGLAMYCVGVSWVYVSLSTYGGMPLWMGSIAVVGFASLPSLTIAAAGYLAAVIIPNGGAIRLCLLPIVWVIGEWLKSWFLTGFAWLDIGYTQTSSWLFSYAPVGGVYLISAVVAYCSVCALLALVHRQFLFPTIAVLSLIGSSLWLNSVQWSAPAGEAIKVGIVQANVPIDRKWQVAYRDNVINKLRSLSMQISSKKISTDDSIDLIVWPETALPLYLQQTDPVFWRSMTDSKTALLTGIIDSPNLFEASSGDSYNAAVLQCGEHHHNSQQVYRKRHLVPFGEFLPFRFLFNWVLEYLELPMTDFSAWQGQQDLSCGNNINIGLSICYEDAFAAEVRDHVGNATILVNISEDAWFGDSFAPHQRLQMGQMRARELSRPMVRSANSGPSAFLDHRGRVLQQSTQFQVATLKQTVQTQTGDTLFKRFGNWVVYLCLILVMVLAVRRARR